MSDINVMLAEIEIKSSGVETVSKSAADQMKVVRERIRNGETTGDRIKDLILSRGLWATEETEKTLREVQSKITEHPGEFILAIERT